MESELARVQNTENHIMQQDIESTVVDVKEIMQDSCQVLTAAAISPSRVICTGWAVAASPTARACIKPDSDITARWGLWMRTYQ